VKHGPPGHEGLTGRDILKMCDAFTKPLTGIPIPMSKLTSVVVPIYTPNLTPDMETGIGRWTEDQFVRAVRDGVRPDGRRLSAPMFAYQELSDAEARAVYAYLRSIPAIRQRP
jgi:hypothetical protein